MKAKFFAAIATFVLTLAVSTPARAVLITNFGSSSFAIDAGSTSFAFNQGSSSTQITGTDFGNTFSGTFDAFDLSSFTEITLTGFATTNPSSDFVIQFLDPTFTDTKTYSANFSSFGSSPTTVTLTFLNQSAAFNTIGALVLTAGGSGDSLNFTLQSLEAVPEPATWMLLAGSMTTVMLLRRRRNARA